MSRRRESDGAGSVLSFTFLDVLMCTMGSLLLLLVVFGVIAKKSTRARRAGEDVRMSLSVLDAPDAPEPSAAAPTAEELAAAAAASSAAQQITEQLAQLRSQQAEVDRIRGEAAQRRLEEQDRISHLEDHERRLEHELGQLHVTLQVLEASEHKQIIDQEQAEAEVERLKELVAETEARLDELRKNGSSEKSYAIVPYKGANGTFRQPVFIECTADAVTIQPEGIRLTVEDFDGPLRSGNPLAAAIRAAHEELNGRAVAAGRTDLPDPYPLLIVRPDGASAYAAALDAIRSWDSDYGYEFVEADWKLKYSEPDPRLAQIMAHAVDEARQRQALLAKAAPRQYASRLSGSGNGSGGSGVTSGAGDGGGFGELTSSGGGDRIGAHGGDGPLAGGRQSANSQRGGHGLGMSDGAGGTGGGNFSDEFAGGDGSAAAGQSLGGPLTTGQGGAAGPGGGGSGSGPGGTGGPGSYAAGQGAAGATAVGGDRYATTGANGQPQQLGQLANGAANKSADGTAAGAAGSAASGQAGGTDQSAAGAGDMASGSASGSAGAAAGGGESSRGASGGGGSSSSGSASGGTGSSSSMVKVGTPSRSAADTRGANWANAEAARRTSAITRPVRVVVNAGGLTVLPESGASSDAAVVSFQQPVDRVLDQLAGAVQMQVVDWGLAGDGMYWRPTLVVTVAPGGQRQAERLAELLEDSGLDVRLPQATASATQPERQ